jgi:pimeloyl-ACP methyl ester carboxylesterase
MVADRLRHITQPVCIIHGDADPLVPIGNGRALQRHLPNASFVLLPDIGHLPTWECPEVVAKAIVDFIG